MINRLIVAFITSSSNLVPLLEGLCSSNPCRFEFSILSFCRNRTNDLAVDSPVLWPTKQVLHRLGQWWWWAIMGPRPDYRRFQVNHTFDGPLRLNGKDKKSRNSCRVSSGGEDAEARAWKRISSRTAILKPTPNAHRLSLLSHQLPSALCTLVQDYWGFQRKFLVETSGSLDLWVTQIGSKVPDTSCRPWAKVGSR